MIRIEIPPGESVEVTFEGTDGKYVVRFDADASRCLWEDFEGPEQIHESPFVNPVEEALE